MSLLVLTVVIETAAIGCAIYALQRVGSGLTQGARAVKLSLTLAVTTLWLLGALGVAVLLWALTLLKLGLFATLEESFYFCGVAFTTLGFGDVTLEQGWRLLSPLIAANGLVLFSLSTAFLIEVVRHLAQPSPQS